MTCPTVPGLVTYGETLDEARAMAADAIRGYIECLREDGEPIPESDPAPVPLIISQVSIGPHKSTESSVNLDFREGSRRSPANLRSSMRHFCPLASTSSVVGPISCINQSSRFLALFPRELFRTTHCSKIRIERVIIRKHQ